MTFSLGMKVLADDIENKKNILKIPMPKSSYKKCEIFIIERCGKKRRYKTDTRVLPTALIPLQNLTSF